MQQQRAKQMQTKICFPHSKQISHTSWWCCGMARDGRPRPLATRSAHCWNYSLGSIKMLWETNFSHMGWLAMTWTWPALWFHSFTHTWKCEPSNSLSIYCASTVIQAEPGTRGGEMKDTETSPLDSLLGAHNFSTCAPVWLSAQDRVHAALSLW